MKEPLSKEEFVLMLKTDKEFNKRFGREEIGMALPPCHIMQMYTITPSGELNSSFVMRSVDLLFGLPFNIMSYALLNKIFAKHLGLESGEMTFFGHDCHIYKNQYELVEELLERVDNHAPSCHIQPTLKINKDLSTIGDIMTLEFSDIVVDNYNPLPPLSKKVAMAK